MTASGSNDGNDPDTEVEIGRVPNAVLGDVIVSTLKGEGIQARLAGTRIMVESRFQKKARDIVDFLRSEIAKQAR